MDILKNVLAHKDLLVEMRRHLHAHPELSSKEFETLEFVKGKLTEFGIQFEEIKNGGILAWVGDESKGKKVLLRADLDALPLQENPKNLSQEKVVVSQNDGVCHACGHDGHTSMLLVAGKVLKEMESELKGKVYLIFERGEEGTGNYKYILRHFAQQNLVFDAIYGTHLLSTYETGKFSVEAGGVMAGAFVFDVTIVGRGGHGSRPDLSISPIDCFVSFYNSLKEIRMNQVSPFESLTFSVGKLQSGFVANVIPEELNFSGTARFFQRSDGMQFKETFLHLLESITKAYNCTYRLNRISAPGFGVMNDPSLSDLAKRAIATHLGEDKVGKEDPWMASESFSTYLALYPGVFAFLGMKNEAKGVGAEHHNERFDIDEDVLPLGAAAAAAYAVEFLNSDIVPDFTGYAGGPMQLLKDTEQDNFED